MRLQAQAQAQAQNMAFQAHNLQAHAQQLEVESAHPVSSHINVGLQHQVDQVHAAMACQHSSVQALQMCAPSRFAVMHFGVGSVPAVVVNMYASWENSMWLVVSSCHRELLYPLQ